MSLKVLIITYYWPPSGGAGVQRWTYFAKNLKKLGVTPIIVTIDPKNAAYPSYDTSFENEIKDIEVHYTSGGSILNVYSFLKTGTKNKAIPTGDFGTEKKSIFDKITGFIRGNFFIPDARVGWNKKAFALSKEIIKKNNIEIVITTGPPHSTHLVGLKLQEELKIKWVADFRDPWREVFYNHLFHRTKFADKKDARLEKQVLTNATVVLTVGPSMQELLASKIEKNKEKVKYLLNGYESELFDTLKKEKEGKNFTISYIGSLNTNYPYSIFLQSVVRIKEKYASEFTFICAGKIEENILQEFNKCEAFTFDYKGIVKHNEAVQLMKNSDLLLLFLPSFGNTQIMVTGKLMEYLATGNPILCIGDTNSDAAKILLNYENCCSANIDEGQKIENFIQKIFVRNKEEGTTLTSSQQYSRFEITKELVRILKSI